METNDNSVRIERYLTEQMTAEESKSFLNDLKNDRVLREEAQMMAMTIKDMKQEQAKQDAEIIEEVLAKKKAKTVRMIRWTVSIAAMFVLIFGATLFWNRQSDSDALFTEYYTPYTIQGESRGGSSDVEKELSTLFNQVGTEKDITPVIDQLKKIYDSIETEYEYSLYTDTITWYLTLAYIKENEFDKAKKLLKPLVENGHAKAEKLMKAIENR